MKIMQSLLFAIAYALFSGMSFICFLRLLAIAASPFANAASYPRLFPFCVMIGILSLFMGIGIILLRLCMLGKEPLDAPVKGRILVEILVALVLFLPAAALWNTVLQKLSQLL